jgi:hypothetical protein
MRPIIAVLSGSLAFASFAAAPATAEAHPRVLAKPKPATQRGPTEITKKVKLSPNGLAFGMSLEEISRLYEKVIDDEFVPLYQNVEPGPRMAELDAEKADKKQLILRNKLEFGNIPSGLDNTPLGPEFTYKNGESMTHLKLRSGVERYFFFFGNRLWKVYDVHKLGKKDKLGADYDAAVESLTKQLGKSPRVRKADSGDVRFDQADWEDKETVIRLIDHGGGAAALAYIERKVEENLGKFRTHSAESGTGVDPSVADVTRGDKPTQDKNKNVVDAYRSKGKK